MVIKAEARSGTRTAPQECTNVHVQQERWRRRIDIILGQNKIAGVIIPGPDREGDGRIMGTWTGLDQRSADWQDTQTRSSSRCTCFDVYIQLQAWPEYDTCHQGSPGGSSRRELFSASRFQPQAATTERMPWRGEQDWNAIAIHGGIGF